MALDPELIASIAEKVVDLRQILVTTIDVAGSDIFAQEHFNNALAALDQAASNLRLASYHQARSNAAGTLSAYVIRR